MNSTAVLNSRYPGYLCQKIGSLCAGIALLLSGFSAFADINPASPFTDHMVLQRNASVPVWGMANPGERVTVSFDRQQRSILTGADGKWMIRLGAMQAGGPFVMQIKGGNTITIRDIYVGEVWLCSGQSNMDMTVAREDRYWCGVYNEPQEVAAADYPLIRVFDVDFVTNEEPVAQAKGTWEICSPATVGHFSAAAYFFARELFKKYKLPIGLITTAYGASTAEAWTSKKKLESDPLFAELLRNYDRRKADYDTSLTAIGKYATAYIKWQADSAAAKQAKKDPPRGPRNPDPKRDQHSPYVLYNGMVAPLIPYAIRGATWYQGESNGPTADIYDRLMAALIDNWRADWGQGNFPFIYVQLANNGKSLDTIPGIGGATTRIRERQLNDLSVPNTAMVVAIDNADDPANIHPKNKQEIGRRMALDAESLAYGEKISYSGPIYERMKVEGNAIRLSFIHTEGGLMAKGNDSASRSIPGLTSRDGKLTGFAISGADKKFVWADAKIDGETILVSCPAIPAPVAVRYGWGDNPLISIYNKAGLPASPFRTDDWSVIPSSVKDNSSHFTSGQIFPHSWKFDLSGGNAGQEYIAVPRGTLYSPENGYGFDLGSTGGGRPFYFSVKLPEGNYNVSVTLGDQKEGSVTTIKAECRRLMVEKITTAPGQFATRNFTVHVRDSVNHRTGIPVRIKGREYAFLHWDNKLTLEFTNSAPRVRSIEITPADHPVTIFLAGNSTVVDQAFEPWAAWGQMIPSFFAPATSVIANYAESGETLKAFVNEGRLDKIWSIARPGDYLFIEFAHNDQKEGPNYLDPFTTYKQKLAWYIGEARQRGMIPILVTSMNRRSFDPSGHIINTLGDYPEAMRQTARELNTALIDLNAMSKTLYEAWGPERSVHAFVHYPAHTFPDQDKELKDDTHFNSYGAYELAKCVVKGIKEHIPELVKYLADGLPDFDPAHPDPIDSWNLPMSTSIYLRHPERDIVFPPHAASATPLPRSGSIYNILDFGAVGDGKTPDTRAINQAIERAAVNGGGTVWFPAGTWLAYSIHLRSNISLYLDQGAVLLAADSSPSDSTEEYDAPEPNEFHAYQDFGHSHWHNSLIWGENLTNISILGPGIIWGRGLTRETPHPEKGPGNKAIALKLCRNVIFRDFTILFGGHFAILATGVDNFTVDNVKMDTNRDGIDVDCCRQVHISNCSINSPWDDGICLKSSYGLGFARATENVTITGCLVSGFDRGTFYDGTYQQNETNLVPDRDGPTGRIKFGTESNGGFKNISISNCVFDHCRGLALETVDGGLLEDVTISNITMRDIDNSPIFLRLGSRMRGPSGTPVGALRRVSISDVTVYNADSRFASIISGIPGHDIEDIRLNNIRIWYKPLDPADKLTGQAPSEKEDKYPEPAMFGVLPAYGFFIRHVKNIHLHDVELNCAGNETRPAFLLQDTEGMEFLNIKARNAKPVTLK